MSAPSISGFWPTDKDPVNEDPLVSLLRYVTKPCVM